MRRLTLRYLALCCAYCIAVFPVCLWMVAVRSAVGLHGVVGLGMGQQSGHWSAVTTEPSQQETP